MVFGFSHKVREKPVAVDDVFCAGARHTIEFGHELASLCQEAKVGSRNIGNLAGSILRKDHQRLEDFRTQKNYLTKYGVSTMIRKDIFEMLIALTEAKDIKEEKGVSGQTDDIQVAVDLLLPFHDVNQMESDPNDSHLTDVLNSL